MSINMADVKKIEMPGPPVTIYKQTFSFTSPDVYNKTPGEQGGIRCTIYSKTTPTWSGSTGADLYTYLGNLGYTQVTSGRYYLPVDNVYDIECDVTINNISRTNCAISTFQIRSGGLYIYCQSTYDSITGALDQTRVTISASEWEPIGTYTNFDFVYKQYTASNPPYSLTICKNNTTNQEYISNYVYSGVQYPNVTISSVSGDSYTLSDGNTYIVTDYTPASWSTQPLEVVKIENLNGDVLWQKKVAQGYHIKYNTYYINTYSTYNVTTSTTASTVWYIDDDNRIYCLVGTTKRYLQFQVSGNRVVYTDTAASSGYEWLYKNGAYITGTYSDTTYYLYRYGSGQSGVRMRTSTALITFEPVSS